MTFNIDEARFIVSKLKENWAFTVTYLGELKRTKNINWDHCMFSCPRCGELITLLFTHYGLFEGNCYNCIDKKQEAFAYVAMAVPFRPHIDMARSYLRFFYPQRVLE